MYVARIKRKLEAIEGARGAVIATFSTGAGAVFAEAYLIAYLRRAVVKKKLKTASTSFENDEAHFGVRRMV
jgi:hypothetical protein